MPRSTVSSPTCGSPGRRGGSAGPMSDREPDDDGDHDAEELPEDSPARAVVDDESDDVPEPNEPA